MNESSISKIEHGEYTSSISVMKPEKSIYIDTTSNKLEFKEDKQFTSSVSIIPKKDGSFEQKVDT